MGWSSGSEIMQAVIKVVKKEVPDSSQRTRIYKPILEAMENHDWDCQNEVMEIDPAFDKLIEQED